jgi:hypothetical protein
MSTLRTIFIAIFITIVTGCASSHNLRDGDGSFDGGFQVSKVSESIFYIYARTNGGMSANHEAAKKMFLEQAKKSCSSENIGAVKTSSRLDSSKFSFLVVTELTGYAICLDSGLTDKQVSMAIDKYETN